MSKKPCPDPGCSSLSPMGVAFFLLDGKHFMPGDLQGDHRRQAPPPPKHYPCFHPGFWGTEPGRLQKIQPLQEVAMTCGVHSTEELL